MDNNVIEMSDVSKKFAQRNVLEKINFKISKQEIFALLGPSGSGKSTILKILTGQMRVSGGVAKVMGVSTNNFDSEIYTKFGLVTESGGLYERLSCFDNLKLFTKIHNVDSSLIYEYLKLVNLSDDAETLVSKLSRGMRQRLLLARATIHKPKILFLDEPTTGLDPYTAQFVYNLLFDMRKAGTTILLTTHNMGEAEKICDKVAFLYKGKIVRQGIPSELCSGFDDTNMTIEKLFMDIVEDGEKNE